MRKGTASVGAAAVGRRWVLRWEEAVKGTPAGKVRMASPKLVVEGIGCCCVAWWRPALMTLWAAVCWLRPCSVVGEERKSAERGKTWCVAGEGGDGCGRKEALGSCGEESFQPGGWGPRENGRKRMIWFSERMEMWALVL
jgi:hypothetical protein